MSLIRLENQSGQSVKQGDLTITPIMQTFQVNLPELPGGFFKGALTWNRPMAVEVEDSDGAVEVLPIIDVTRIALLAMLGGSLLCGLVLWLLSKKRR